MGGDKYDKGMEVSNEGNFISFMGKIYWWENIYLVQQMDIPGGGGLSDQS